MGVGYDTLVAPPEVRKIQILAAGDFPLLYRCRFTVAPLPFPLPFFLPLLCRFPAVTIPSFCHWHICRFRGRCHLWPWPLLHAPRRVREHNPDVPAGISALMERAAHRSRPHLGSPFSLDASPDHTRSGCVWCVLGLGCPRRSQAAAWLPRGCRLAAAQGCLGRPGAGLPPAKPGCRVAAAWLPLGCRSGVFGASWGWAAPGEARLPRGCHVAAAWLPLRGVWGVLGLGYPRRSQATAWLPRGCRLAAAWPGLASPGAAQPQDAPNTPERQPRGSLASPGAQPQDAPTTPEWQPSGSQAGRFRMLFLPACAVFAAPVCRFHRHVPFYRCTVAVTLAVKNGR
eukprot:gene16977-biopygen11347